MLRRRLFTLLSALSLLLCAAVCVLWGRSRHLSDQVAWRCEGGWRRVQSAEGRVVVGLLLADHSGHPGQFYGPRYERDVPAPPQNWLLEMGGSVGDALADHE